MSTVVRPYGLIADLHAHSWSAFAGIDEQGRNTRLTSICAELLRCAEETRKAGGHRIVIAGDLFHVRGSVSPEVFNPVRETLKQVCKIVAVEGIPGNHDLTGRYSTELGSSLAMLTHDLITWAHEPRVVWENGNVLIPWFPTVDETLFAIGLAAVDLHPTERAKRDLILHRGIDGTLSGMPGTGFTAEKLAAFGFKRVFAGDYHHHAQLAPNIYSIGAATHLTWGDIGTKAGFLIVHPDRVDWHCTHAPRFIDITSADDPDDLALTVEGQFVRARIGEATAADVAGWRKQLLDMGAKGVLIDAVPKSASEKREGVSVKSLATLDKSVMDYVSERGMPPEVAAICGKVMKEVLE